MEFKDYYKTLGVAKAANEKEIKQAYRKLARKFHPDVNPGNKAAESRFKEINEAYEVLGDPEKRRKYDELGANWRLYEQQAAQGGAPFGGFGQWGATGGPTGFRTLDEEEMRRIFGDEDPFSDFFRAFFGGAARGGSRNRRAARARSGGDLEHEIELTLEEVLRGATRQLIIRHEGQPRTVNVRIPPGIGDLSRVRVAGEGEAGRFGGSAGDLYLRVRVRPHPRIQRDGRDLRTKVPVPVTTAVLGGEAEVETLGGRLIRLKIPPGTASGQVFRLKGHGLPAVGRPDDRGDLFAAVDILVPTRLTREERRHYEALANLAGRAAPAGTDRDE